MDSSVGKQPAARRQPLAQRAYAMIKDDILSHRLLPRESLRESELALRYEISKTPVREALLILVQEGIVEMNAFRGMRVRDFSALDAVEIYQLKEVLEPLAVELSVPAMTEQDFSLLRGLLQQGRDAIERGEPQEVSRLNKEFHQGMIAKCGNSRLLETLESLQNQIRVMSLRFWKLRGTYVEEAEQHERILEAAAGGEVGRTAELLREHYAHFREQYIQQME